MTQEYETSIQQLRLDLERASEQVQSLKEEREALVASSQEQLKRAEKAIAEAEGRATLARRLVIEGFADKETREHLQTLLQERDSQLAQEQEQLDAAMQRSAEAEERAEERAEEDKRLLQALTERVEAYCRRCEDFVPVEAERRSLDPPGVRSEEALSVETGKNLAQSGDHADQCE